MTTHTPSTEEREELGKVLHHGLVELAGKWLAKSCKIAVTEVQTYSTELPDCFGWQNGQVHWLDDKYVSKERGFIFTTLIEVKVSRSDFLADFKKPHRQMQETGMGNYRYYCCPDGMIKPDELPENWGLLYAKNGKVKSIKTAKFVESNKVEELWLLYNAAYKGKGICQATAKASEEAPLMARIDELQQLAKFLAKAHIYDQDSAMKVRYHMNERIADLRKALNIDQESR